MNIKKYEKNIVLFLILAAFFLFNFLMTDLAKDDIHYLGYVNTGGYLNTLMLRYQTWSSRVVIEFFLMLFSKNFMLWRLLNSFVMFGTVILMCKYIFKKIEIKSLLFVFAIYCFIPLRIMGETGWIATSINYHWPVFFAMVAFYPFYQLLINEKINHYVYFLAIPLLIFGANQEQVNLCFFVLTSLMTVFLLKQNKYDYKLSLLSVISFSELIFFLTAPGNENRASKEIINWFPEYKDFGLANKIDLGLSSFGKPFFFDFNILFILFFALLFVLIYKKNENYYLRLISSVPLIFNLIIYFGNTQKLGFLNVTDNSNTMIWSSDRLDNLFSRYGTGISFTHPKTWLATLVILSLISCVIISLYLIFENKKISIFFILLFLMGMFSRFIMGFTPTVWASGMRTYYVLYMVMAILVLILFEELKNNIDNRKMDFIQLVISVTGICTFILVFFDIVI